MAHAYGAIAFYLDHQADVDAYLLRRKEQWAEWNVRELLRVLTCRLVLNVPAGVFRFRGNEGAFSSGQ